MTSYLVTLQFVILAPGWFLLIYLYLFDPQGLVLENRVWNTDLKFVIKTEFYN